MTVSNPRWPWHAGIYTFNDRDIAEIVWGHLSHPIIPNKTIGKGVSDSLHLAFVILLERLGCINVHYIDFC